MTTNNNNNQTANNNALTNKVINALRKKANEYKDGFKSACSVFLELSATDKDAKKVCTYLGINTESLKNKNIKDTRDNVLSRLPLYYMIDGSETHFPAKLTKINKNAGIDGYIATKDTYINALLALAKILSAGNEYTQVKLNLTIAVLGKDETEYNNDNVIFTAYNKEGIKLKIESKKYIEYLNVNRLANKAANIAKSAFFSEKKNVETEGEK